MKKAQGLPQKDSKTSILQVSAAVVSAKMFAEL